MSLLVVSPDYASHLLPLASLATAWRDAGEGTWPPGFPEAKRGAYDAATIRRWLEVFCRRFFAFAQFKRSALPNGPKVVAGGSLSPRGDWRAPSDSSAAAWLADLERWPPEAWDPAG